MTAAGCAAVKHGGREHWMCQGDWDWFWRRMCRLCYGRRLYLLYLVPGFWFVFGDLCRGNVALVGAGSLQGLSRCGHSCFLSVLGRRSNLRSSYLREEAGGLSMALLAPHVAGLHG